VSSRSDDTRALGPRSRVELTLAQLVTLLVLYAGLVAGWVDVSLQIRNVVAELRDHEARIRRIEQTRTIRRELPEDPDASRAN
jgi:site-specific recombinase